MDQAELTDHFISRPQSLGWFLGAGASRMSGLPTATDIIWDLKRRYYCREENQDVGRQDLQSRAVQARIQSFMGCARLSAALGRCGIYDLLREDIWVRPKNTPFREDEILGALDSFRDSTEVELVQIVKDVEWKGVWYNTKQEPTAHGYPVERGVYLPIDTDEVLLWTQGNVKGVHLKNPIGDVYKEGSLKPVPSPILVRRFTGAGGWHETCAGILGLTKMDWNNNTLYKELPVSLVYSGRFASVLKQNQEIVDAILCNT